MPRPLSNIEYATFMSEVQPQNLNFPQWGGVVQWGGEFVLCFPMPDGTWALSDITDGIPSGSNIVPAAQWLQQFPSYQVSWTDAFIYSLPSNFMQTAAIYAANAASLASNTAVATADTVGQVMSKILGGISAGIQPISFPIALVAIAIIFLYVNPLKSKANN